MSSIPPTNHWDDWSWAESDSEEEEEEDPNEVNLRLRILSILLKTMEFTTMDKSIDPKN